MPVRAVTRVGNRARTLASESAAGPSGMSPGASSVWSMAVQEKSRLLTGEGSAAHESDQVLHPQEGIRQVTRLVALPIVKYVHFNYFLANYTCHQVKKGQY